MQRHSKFYLVCKLLWKLVNLLKQETAVKRNHKVSLVGGFFLVKENVM